MSESNQKNERFELSWNAISFLESPSPWILGAAIILIATSMVLAAVLSFFIHINVSVKSLGETDSLNGVKPAIAALSGQVYHLPHQEGDIVRKDQVIAWLRMDGTHESEIRALRLQLDKKISLLETETYQADQLDIDYKNLKNTALSSYVIDVERKFFSLKNAQKNVNDSIQKQMRPLTDRKKMIDRQLNYISKLSFKSYMEMQKISLEDEKSKIQQQLTVLEREAQSNIFEAKASLRQSLQMAISQLDLFIQQHQVRAPISGRIGRLALSKGGYIKAQESLAIIIPEDSPVIGRLLIKDADLPKVKIGSECRLDIESFPAYKYGYFSGKIISIENVKSMDDQSKNLYYVAKISIDLDVLDRRPAFVQETQEKISLVPGMKMEAQIISRRASLASLLIDKLFGRNR